jgi:hypothetical protein
VSPIRPAPDALRQGCPSYPIPPTRWMRATASASSCSDSRTCRTSILSVPLVLFRSRSSDRSAASPSPKSRAGSATNTLRIRRSPQKSSPTRPFLHSWRRHNPGTVSFRQRAHRRKRCRHCRRLYLASQKTVRPPHPRLRRRQVHRHGPNRITPSSQAILFTSSYACSKAQGQSALLFMALRSP